MCFQVLATRGTHNCPMHLPIIRGADRHKGAKVCELGDHAVNHVARLEAVCQLLHHRCSLAQYQVPLWDIHLQAQPQAI